LNYFQLPVDLFTFKKNVWSWSHYIAVGFSRDEENEPAKRRQGSQLRPVLLDPKLACVDDMLAVRRSRPKNISRELIVEFGGVWHIRELYRNGIIAVVGQFHASVGGTRASGSEGAELDPFRTSSGQNGNRQQCDQPGLTQWGHLDSTILETILQYSSGSVETRMRRQNAAGYIRHRRARHRTGKRYSYSFLCGGAFQEVLVTAVSSATAEDDDSARARKLVSCGCRLQAPSSSRSLSWHFLLAFFA